MNSKEALKQYKEIYVDKTSNFEFQPTQEWYLDIIKQDLDRLEELEKYACKYKSLVSGKLWRDGKERTKWFNKIRNQKDWIDCLSKLREFGSNDEEQFLRVVKHLDTQVLYWALSSLEKEIKRYSEEKFEDD